MADHLAIVQSIYEAFGRSDIAAILAPLADNVEWEAWPDNTAQRAGVPWLQSIRGKENVVAFFQIVGQWKFNDFQLVSLMSGQNRVAAEVIVDATLPSGARVSDEEMHLWTFDDQGKIVRFRHYLDTAKHITAAGLTLPAAQTR